MTNKDTVYAVAIGYMLGHIAGHWSLPLLCAAFLLAAYVDMKHEQRDAAESDSKEKS